LQATAEALSVAVRNAVTFQEQVNVTAQSGAVMGVSTSYSLDTASTGVGTKKILYSAKLSAPEIETATSVASSDAPSPSVEGEPRSLDHQDEPRF
jgi:hypothetical protein